MKKQKKKQISQKFRAFVEFFKSLLSLPFTQKEKLEMLQKQKLMKRKVTIGLLIDLIEDSEDISSQNSSGKKGIEKKISILDQPTSSTEEQINDIFEREIEKLSRKNDTKSRMLIEKLTQLQEEIVKLKNRDE